jgi:hypothetical protein
MANLLFRLEPITIRQVEINIPDEEWTNIRDLRPEGDTPDELYKYLTQFYHPLEVSVEVYGGGNAYDMEIRDCDCKKKDE